MAILLSPFVRQTLRPLATKPNKKDPVERWDREAALAWWRMFPADLHDEAPAPRPSEVHTIAVDAMQR